MIYTRFIIEGNILIMAKCDFHKNLATNKDNVKGGGFFRYDSDKDAFILSGTSHDFGRAELKDIKACIDSGSVYGNVRQTRKMDNHKFFYDNHGELTELN